MRIQTGLIMALLLCTCFFGDTKPVVAQAPLHYSLSVVVFTDLNGNKIMDAGETRIHGATVTLIIFGATEAGKTQTDAEGQALFENLYADEYGVCENITHDWQTTTGKCVHVLVGEGLANSAQIGNKPTVLIPYLIK